MAKSSFKTFIKKNTLPALIKRLEIEKSGASVEIGFQGQEAEDKKTSKEDGVEMTNLDALTLVEVATFHEFGTVHVHQRSFLRSNDRDNRKKYRNMITEIKDKIIFESMTITRGLSLLGEQIRADIQTKIRAGINPALAASTIKAKGSSKPLIDTGQLVAGITYKVKGDKK